MQRPFYLLMLLMFLLAACGGGGGDSAAPPPDDQAPQTGQTAPQTGPELPTAIVLDAHAQATPEVFFDEDGVPFMMPSDDEDDTAAAFEAFVQEVLADAPAFEPPPSPTPASEGALPLVQAGTLVASETQEAEPPGDFTRIYLRQEGGLAAEVTVIEIFGDGRVVQDGQTYLIGQDVIAELNRRIEALNFFGLQGTFLGPPGDDDTYRYRIAVTSGFQERAINAQDNYMPVEFANFLGYVRSVADAAISAG